MLKGTIIENSLADRSVLQKVQIKKTWRSGDWILHDVLVAEDVIPQLGAAIDRGPWYIHLWRSGEDKIIVLFKDATFTLSASDASTWTNAIQFGKSIGIPEKQLNFPID